LSGKWFDPKDVELLILANKKYNILEKLRNGEYENELIQFYYNYPYDVDSTISILETLVFIIDFRNEETVVHTISSAVMARRIGTYFNMSEEELGDIYFATLLHDIGKIAVPIEILESKSYLNHEEMKIMQGHVYETKKIIDGLVSENIINIAVRHHERSDGSGYPLGLFDEHLSLSDKIVAVADVVSALNEKRSYKILKSKSEVQKIMKDMAAKNELDPVIINLVLEHYDEIIDEVMTATQSMIARYEDMKENYVRLVHQSKRMHLGVGQEKFMEWGMFDFDFINGFTKSSIFD
jgi:HD-GYP domain-containing protein (c-di-GMP phosphodiesterase class II)